MTAPHARQPQVLPRPACTPTAIRAVLAANADAGILRRYDEDLDAAFEQAREQGDVTPLVQTVKRWWFEADAWRDPEAQREFLARIETYRHEGPPPAEQRTSREEIRAPFGALIGSEAITFCSWQTVIAMVRRGTGSWTEPPAQTVQLAASAARLRGIRAGSATGAPGWAYRRWTGEPEPPCCDVRLSVRFVTMILMSEMPAGDTHDVIHHGGQVVAVVVPIGEYQQLRQAMQEQQVNEEFDAARSRYLARREAGTIRYVSHEEAGRRLGLPSR
jgi:hypothetical protein